MAREAHRLEYGVEVATDWSATGDRGGSVLLHEDGVWTPEHLLLAALCRCTLTSFRHHARRAELQMVGQGGARGVVTRRETDGRYAFVAIDVDVRVALDPAPDADAVQELVGKAERDCFVGASLTAPPTYRWTVNGEEVA